MFQNPEENGQYSRAIFHNINAKQVPLNLEENLKVIKQAGYRLGFTVNPGSVDLGEDLYNIQRTPIFEVPYRNLCFVFRLHFPEFVGDLWHFRNYLIKNGHENIANRIPTF